MKLGIEKKYVLLLIMIFLLTIGIYYLGKDKREVINNPIPGTTLSAKKVSDVFYYGIKDYNENRILVLNDSDKGEYDLVNKQSKIKGENVIELLDNGIYLTETGLHKNNKNVLFIKDMKYYEFNKEYEIFIFTTSNNKTYFYDLNFKKIMLELDGEFNNYVINKEKSLRYYVVETKNQDYLIDLETFEKIYKPNSELGDVKVLLKCKCASEVHSNSDTYIKVKSDKNKYGIIDFKGNNIIPMSYDKLLQRSNNNKFFSVKSGKYYGLIDNNNKVKLGFRYDLILVYNNFILTIKNYKLEILDMSLNNINDKKYELKSFSENENDFNVKELNTGLLIHRGGLSSLIVSNNKKVKEKMDIEYIEDVYNIESKDYYRVTDYNKNKIIIYDNDLKNKLVVPLKNKSSLKNENTIDAKIIKKNEIGIIYKGEDNSQYFVIEMDTGIVLKDGKTAKNYIKSMNRFENGLYSSKEGKYITIYSSGFRELIKVKATSIKYLRNNYYAVEKEKKKWFLYKIN